MPLPCDVSRHRRQAGSTGSACCVVGVGSPWWGRGSSSLSSAPVVALRMRMLSLWTKHDHVGSFDAEVVELTVVAQGEDPGASVRPGPRRRRG